jgi:HrpA-like RNA helicase
MPPPLWQLGFQSLSAISALETEELEQLLGTNAALFALEWHCGHMQVSKHALM